VVDRQEALIRLCGHRGHVLDESPEVRQAKRRHSQVGANLPAVFLPGLLMRLVIWLFTIEGVVVV
jgi:hypothetical protein